MITYSQNPLESVKLSAKALQKAIVVALSPSSSSHNHHTAIKPLSLQQCQSVIAIGCGYNTYNGLLSDIQNINSLDFDYSRIDAPIIEFILQANPIAELFNLEDACFLHAEKGTAEIIDNVKAILQLFQAYPFLKTTKTPTDFMFYHCSFDEGQFGALSGFYEHDSRFIYSWFSSLIINSINDFQSSYIGDSKTLIEIPINFFSEDIFDIRQAQSRQRDLEDLFSSLDVVDVWAGLLEFQNPSESKISWVISTEIYEVFKMISQIKDADAKALEYLNSLIGVYPPTFIPSPKIEANKGKSKAWLLLYRYIFFSVIKKQKGLPLGGLCTSLHTVEERRLYCDISDYFGVINRQYADCGKDAVVSMDAIADDVILPYLRESEALSLKLKKIIDAEKTRVESSNPACFQPSISRQIDELKVAFMYNLIKLQNELR